MKHLFFLFAIIISISYSFAQVPDKAAPFTAVKWENETPIVKVDEEWFTLKQIDGIDAGKIIAHCKKEYGDKWQKRFSEDLVEALKGMGHTPQTQAKLTLLKGNTTVQKTAAMTKENRQAVWQYNNGNTSTTAPKPSAATTTAEPKKETVQSTTTQKQSPQIADVIKAPSGSFKIKACKITFEYTGIITGTDVFYFDDYGKVAVLEMNRTGFDGKKETIIWKDGKSTHINHKNKTVAQSPFRPKDTEPPTIAYVSEQQRKNEGYEKLSNETIAGKNCEVYNHTKMKVKYWLWNNIDLRMENYALGKNGYIKNAVKVEDISKIPDEMFAIPAGYKK
jgi:hypothetical protein